MKKALLQQIIKEELQNVLAEASLSLGKRYQVYDPGMDQWNSDYEYLGFDSNKREHMFRLADSPGSKSFMFVSVSLSDVNREVKSMKKEGALSEAALNIDSTLKAKLKQAIAARRRDMEDHIAFNDVVDVLTKIYRKLGQASQAKELAQGSMEDHRIVTFNGALNVIKDTLEFQNED